MSKTKRYQQLLVTNGTWFNVPFKIDFIISHRVHFKIFFSV